MKNLGFYPTCKLTSQPGNISWVLTEDTRLLGQGQMTLLLTAQWAGLAWCRYQVPLPLPMSHGALGSHASTCHRVCYRRGTLSFYSEWQARCHFSLPDCSLQARLLEMAWVKSNQGFVFLASLAKMCRRDAQGPCLMTSSRNFTEKTFRLE